MKKILLLSVLLIALFSVPALSQNGGQYNENNLVKVVLTAKTPTELKFTLSNKQTCVASYIVDYGTTNFTITMSGNIDTVIAVTIIANAQKFKVKTTGATCVSQPDMGWVEIDIANALQALPVKFVKFKSELVNGDALITFEIAEAINVKQFNVRMSTYGKSWKIVTVILPDRVQPNRIYSTKIKLQ